MGFRVVYSVSMIDCGPSIHRFFFFDLRTTHGLAAKKSTHRSIDQHRHPPTHPRPLPPKDKQKRTRIALAKQKGKETQTKKERDGPTWRNLSSAVVTSGASYHASAARTKTGKYWGGGPGRGVVCGR